MVASNIFIAAETDAYHVWGHEVSGMLSTAAVCNLSSCNAVSSALP